MEHDSNHGSKSTLANLSRRNMTTTRYESSLTNISRKNIIMMMVLNLQTTLGEGSTPGVLPNYR